MEPTSAPVVAVINVFREHPSLRYADADLDTCHSKCMDVSLYRDWHKSLRPGRRDILVARLQQFAIEALHWDHQRAAWHVYTSWDMPEFHETELHDARTVLYASARVGLFLGMISDVSTRVLEVASGLPLARGAAMRKRLQAHGYLRGTSGIPRSKGFPGTTARIEVPLPNECPRWFDPEPVLPSLEDSDIAAMVAVMNLSRLRKLQAIEESELHPQALKVRARLEATLPGRLEDLLSLPSPSER